MGKGRGLTFTLFAALGALTGYATYMASRDEFSEDTKDKVDTVLNKLQNVGTDIKRTYTSIGDKDSFKENSKNLGNSSLKLANKAGDLIKSGAADMYKFTKKVIADAVEKYTDDDSDSSYDDIDANYITKNTKKKKSTKKTNTSKPKKKTIKKKK